MANQLTPFSQLSEVIKTVMGLMRGEQNNVGSFALKTGATSTVVSFVNCAPGKTVSISPQTANAAAALPTTYIPASTIVAGSFTVMHANAASADRIFSFEVTGGG
jgi:hypothetical protein